MSWTDERVELLKKMWTEGQSASQIAKSIGLSPRATRTRLAKLVGGGIVREIGTGPKDPRRKYYRSE